MNAPEGEPDAACSVARRQDGVGPAGQALTTLFEERTTFYGAREIGVRDPEGNAVLFAEAAAK